ncbi:MFS transporter [Ornithinicoccus hortensis]
MLSNTLDAGSRQAADLGTDIIAVTVLGASATQMGLLNALGTVAFLVLGIPVGVLVDRSPTVRTLLAAGLTRAGLLSTVVLAWWVGGLTLLHLYAVALLAGVCSVVTETTQTALAPRLVGPERVGPLVARMQSAETVVGLVAPAAAGALAAAAGAGPLLGVAVAVTVCSVVVLGMSRRPRPGGADTGDDGATPAGALRRLFSEAGEGWRALVRDAVLLRLTLAAMLVNLGLAIWSAVEVLVVLRTLGLGAEVLGLIVSAGALGGLLGSLVAVPLGARLGAGPLMRCSLALLAPTAALVLVALAAPGHATPLLLTHAFLWGVLMVTYNVHLAGLVAAQTPASLLGRVSATRRTLTMGIVPAGGLLGGVLADAAGDQATVLAWCLLNAAGAGLAFSRQGGVSRAARR